MNTKSNNNFLQNSIVCNLALGFEPEINYENKFKILENYRENAHTLIALHVASDITNFETTMKNISDIHNFIHNNSSAFGLLECPTDIEQAKKQNKTLLTFVFQGTFPLQRNLNYVNLFNKLGVKIMILAYNVANDVGGGCSEGENDCGLTDFGKRLIERMNQTNTIIDLSHCGIKTSLEAIDLSAQPVLFSHSNSRRLFDHTRNLTDEQIKKCAESGGIIGINSIDQFLGDGDILELMIDHMVYFGNLVGLQHVAIGTDQIYFLDTLKEYMAKGAGTVYPQNYTDNINLNIKTFAPQQIYSLVEKMLQRKFTEAEIHGILGLNYINFIKKIS